MLDEFKKLVEDASEAHDSSAVFGQDLIAVLAAYSMPIDLLHESDQIGHREELADTFCSVWGVKRGWLDRILELYIPEAHSDLGHRMRALLHKHAVVNLRAVKNIASA
ncbi:MAG: hypothetical protein ABIS59_01790 [Candidatus Saccharibacteria bacterium]